MLRRETKISNIIVVIMLLLSLMVSFVDRTLVAFGIFLCCVSLLYIDRLFCAFPFVIFYNEIYGQVFGLSVMRVFSFLWILSLLIKNRREIRILWIYLLPIIVYGVFLIFTISQYDIRRMFFGLIDVICCLSIAIKITEDKERYRSFFETYGYVAIIAFFTGILGGFSVEQTSDSNYLYQFVRLLATFEDPNYMGFFYNIAIFAIVTMQLYKSKFIRNVMVVILHIMLAASVSITAVLLNIILWMCYLTIDGKIRPKNVLIILLVVVVLVCVYNYGASNPDAKVIGSIVFRIQEKLVSLGNNDLNRVTTGRLDLTTENLSYFGSLPLMKRLFGGTSANPSFLDANLRATSHNEYVDMLLNVGYIGEFMLLIFIIWRLAFAWRSYHS